MEYKSLQEIVEIKRFCHPVVLMFADNGFRSPGLEKLSEHYLMKNRNMAHKFQKTEQMIDNYNLIIDVLRTSENPLTSFEVSELTGIDVVRVRNIFAYDTKNFKRIAMVGKVGRRGIYSLVES